MSTIVSGINIEIYKIANEEIRAAEKRLEIEPMDEASKFCTRRFLTAVRRDPRVAVMRRAYFLKRRGDHESFDRLEALCEAF